MDWHRRFTAPCARDQLPGLSLGLEAACADHAVPPGVASVAVLVLEELFLNALDHGGLTPDGPLLAVELRGREDHLLLIWSDPGPAFDPLTLDGDAHWQADALQDRPVGGLGLHLVRSMCRAAAYERRAGRNRLELVIALERSW